jgi:hypothetical protein
MIIAYDTTDLRGIFEVNYIELFMGEVLLIMWVVLRRKKNIPA